MENQNVSWSERIQAAVSHSFSWIIMALYMLEEFPTLNTKYTIYQNIPNTFPNIMMKAIWFYIHKTKFLTISAICLLIFLMWLSLIKKRSSVFLKAHVTEAYLFFGVTFSAGLLFWIIFISYHIFQGGSVSTNPIFFYLMPSTVYLWLIQPMIGSIRALQGKDFRYTIFDYIPWIRKNM